MTKWWWITPALKRQRSLIKCDVSIFLRVMSICTTIFLYAMFLRYTYQRRIRHGLAAREDTLTKGKADQEV